MADKLPVTGFSTRAVHAGQEPAGRGAHPTSTPVVHASAFYFDTVEELDRAFDDPSLGSVYTRHGNPTVETYQRAIAALEGSDGAVAFGSGQAAVHAALLASGVRAGTRLVAAQDLYGGTLGLLRTIMAPLGLEVAFVDATNHAAVEAALGERPAVALLIEGISNPLLKVSDVDTLASLANRHGARCIVDNTFASPALYRPLDHGADLVVHSATKYLGGHGDLTGGVVAADAQTCVRLGEVARLVGGILSPNDAWLTLRGIKTLALRMERHCRNATTLAQLLSRHPRVARVNYPGLPDHPQHALASRLFENRGYGGMISFELRDGERSAVFAFMNRLRWFKAAPTLGDCTSLVLYPAMASHRGLSPAERQAIGISDSLVRLSVGIEDAADLQADLDEALG